MLPVQPIPAKTLKMLSITFWLSSILLGAVFIAAMVGVIQNAQMNSQRTAREAASPIAVPAFP